MQQLTADGRREVETIADRHGVSPGAAEAMLEALVAGQGDQAQFSHPELGGMGQWSRGGMLMIGDMFNNALKAKVDALANDLSALLGRGAVLAPASQSQSQTQGSGGPAGVSLFVAGGSGNWWPGDLGAPASVGAQNSLRYAVFPSSRRLAIDRGGKVTVHDTGDHEISGVSQAQSGDQTLTFTSQHGLVRLSELPVVGDADVPAPAREATEAPPPHADPGADREPGGDTRPEAASSGAAGDVFTTLERLAALRDKGILSPEEFAAKKTELLSRL